MVVGTDMIEYIKGMVFSSFFLLTCGAVVRESEAMDGLGAVAKRYALCLKLNPANMFSGCSSQTPSPSVLNTSSATTPRCGWSPMPTKSLLVANPQRMQSATSSTRPWSAPIHRLCTSPNSLAPAVSPSPGIFGSMDPSVPTLFHIPSLALSATTSTRGRRFQLKLLPKGSHLL